MIEILSRGTQSKLDIKDMEFMLLFAILWKFHPPSAFAFL